MYLPAAVMKLFGMTGGGGAATAALSNKLSSKTGTVANEATKQRIARKAPKQMVAKEDLVAGAMTGAGAGVATRPESTYFRGRKREEVEEEGDMMDDDGGGDD